MALLAWGCTSDEIDDVFEVNASQRLDNMMEECMSLLTAAPNGWLIEYYPEEDQSYGGYVFLASFETNGDVTVAGGAGEPDERVTSHFSILSSQSVVLSFDTYNSLFHYYADPDVGSGSSYEGDFEFAFKGGDSSELTFTGVKTGNTIMFTALDSSVDWTTYLTQVADMEYAILTSPYCGYVYDGSGETVSFDMDATYRLLTYAPDSSNPDEITTIAYCYTNDGMKFYEPITLGSSEVQTFRWDATAEEMVCVEDANVVLSGMVSDNYVPYDLFLGDWYLTHGTTGQEETPVSIVTLVEGVSFTLTGLTADVTLGYNKITGQLSLTTQSAGLYGSYYLYFCVWDPDSGYYGWGDGYGFYIVWNGDESDPILTFEDNGSWSYNTSSFRFQAFTSSTPSSSASVGYVSRYYYVECLHK